MPVDAPTLSFGSLSDSRSVNLDYRLPPQNEEAEQALLGAILVNNRAHEKVAEFLKPEHFFNPVHGRIFAAIQKLIERYTVASPITLKSYFEQDGDLAHVGGAEYLADLAASVVTVLNAEDYGRTVHELFLRRQLIALGEDMVNDAYTHDLDVSSNDQIELAEKKLYDLATEGEFEGGFVRLEQSIVEAIKIADAAHRRQSHVTGVTTGLIDMDRLLGGFQRSDLVILAGRPSMGKTALATNMAFNAAEAFADTNGAEGAIVGFFSLEMSASQLATRILADVAEVPSDKIRRGDVKDSDFGRFVEASQRLARVPLFIDDTPALSIGALRTRARRLKRQHGLGLIVIDYLQLMRGTGGARAAESRVLEVSEITRGLKTVAKELDVPVLALSQLSRAVEQREDKRPQLADLRESGSIEQDADVVMFVYREEYYHARSQPVQKGEESIEKFNDRHDRWLQRGNEIHNVAEAIIAKQRHGPIGSVRMHFEGEFTRFSDLDTQHSGS